ncbi:MAG: AHH domain-containing protein, partial [Acinetobacter sp.]
SKYPNGSTTIGLNSSGQETEQLTKATMGQGTVKNTADSTSRDINNTQEITRDQTTGMLDGSVTVDHRLLTESGRAEIIHEQKEIVEQLNQVIEGTQTVSQAVKDGILAARKYEQVTQNMTLEEKNILDNLIKGLGDPSKIDNSWVPVVAEGAVMAGSTCARVPACASAVINLFGAAAASVILNTGDNKKETMPKPLPSTSGNSATGGPSGSNQEPDDESKKVKNYESELNVSQNTARAHLRTNTSGKASEQAHHIIPWELRSHPLIQRASKGGFNINGSENGVRLANHRGSHQYYTQRVK